MAKFTVSFAQWNVYEVEADNVEEAIEQAEEEFESDMRDPIANIVWDEMIVENEEGEEIKHGYC
jgi:hypothetical protein